MVRGLFPGHNFWVSMLPPFPPYQLYLGLSLCIGSEVDDFGDDIPLVPVADPGFKPRVYPAKIFHNQYSV
jgi:hypothetical protein